MPTKKVLVLGGNFAGLTAALSVKHELADDVDVTVVSKSDRFQFGVGNAKGFIDVKDTYQTVAHANIYGVGIAAAVNAPWQSANAVGVPKTGFPAETMARVAAENIASQIRGQEPTKEENFADIPALCIMDAGNNGVAILADKMLPPRKHGVLIPGPQAHAMKLGFEKYFLWKARHGYVQLP
jgi:sulfide:quinone oxidoreductase